MEAKLEPISPRYVKTSRARVWQEEWDPMPWDFCRRSTYTETQRQTYDRDEQREHSKREARVRRYRQYQVHFYGSPGERETKNSHLRTHLKQQLELVEPAHRLFVKRVGESRAIAERTRREELQEKEQERQHRLLLSEFKDTNKMLIEVHAKKMRRQKLSDVREEQRRLTLNPINWNHTLW